jgi:hypothetical protein
VLIVDVNPFWTDTEFHADAINRINVDNDDDDAPADVSFACVFSQSGDGMQTGAAFYATGSRARQSEPAGQVLIQSVPVGLDANPQPRGLSHAAAVPRCLEPHRDVPDHLPFLGVPNANAKPATFDVAA